MKKAIQRSLVASSLCAILYGTGAFSTMAWGQSNHVYAVAWKVDTDFSIYHPDYIQLKRNIQWDNQYLQMLKKNNLDNASSVQTISEVEPGLQKLNEEIVIIEHSEKQTLSKSKLEKLKKEEENIHHLLFKE